MLLNHTQHAAFITAAISVSLSLFASCGNSPTDSNAQIPTSISVSSTQLYLGTGETAKISAEVLDQNHLPIADAALSWSSSDRDVANVSNGGEVTARSYGKAVITVVSASKSAAIPVLVSDDLDALVALYTTLDGPFWSNRTNWLSNQLLHEWHGVTVDARGRVTGIGLEENRLSGGLPSLIGDLDELRILDLSSNSIRGQIPPELGRLSKLETLVLSRNAIRGRIPPSLGDLHNLKYLSLNHNQMIGEIPSSIGNLASLEHLYADENKLSGDIPSSLGGLGNLQILYLRNNQLSGSIPASLGQLASILTLNLSRNNLTGHLPPELANLSRLKDLWLEQNGLSGRIPPQFGNFAVLERMFLSNNLLSGPVPPELGRLNSLWQLVLSNNRSLKGPLPLELTGLTNLSALWLEGTDLCAPADFEFREWLAMVGENGGLIGVEVCTGN